MLSTAIRSGRVAPKEETVSTYMNKKLVKQFFGAWDSYVKSLPVTAESSYDKITRFVNKIDADASLWVVSGGGDCSHIAWDTFGGSITVDKLGVPHVKVTLEINPGTVAYWTRNDNALKRRFTKHPARHHYSFVVKDRGDIDAAIWAIELLFAIRPTRLDFDAM